MIEYIKQRIIAYKTIRKLWQKLRLYIDLERWVDASDTAMQIEIYKREYPITSYLAWVFHLEKIQTRMI